MTLFIRLALLKPYLNAADISARMAEVAPLKTGLQERANAAKAAGDSIKATQLYQEIRNLDQQADINKLKAAVPLLQLPIGFGIFRLLRGMANLPVPGLEDAGFLWLKDLTISDPYYILPAVTGLGIYHTVKVSNDRQSQQSRKELMLGAW